MSVEPPNHWRKSSRALQRLIHRPVTVKYERSAEVEDVAPTDGTLDARRADALSSDPLVQKVVELFEARSLQLEYDDQDRPPDLSGLMRADAGRRPARSFTRVLARNFNAWRRKRKSCSINWECSRN